MTDDLIERLRKARVWPDNSQSRVTIETAHKAADRIEELEAWKAAEEAHHHMLRQELDRCRASNAVMDNTVAALKATLRIIVRETTAVSPDVLNQQMCIDAVNRHVIAVLEARHD